MTTETACAPLPIAPLSIAPARFKIGSHFHRIWPPMVIGFGLIASAMWTTFLGYVIFLIVWRD